MKIVLITAAKFIIVVSSIKICWSMKTIFKNAEIITGDGKTVINRGYVVVHGELITEVGKGRYREKVNDEVIDCKGKILIPGIVNHHEHYLTFGPTLTGEHPIYKEQVIEHLNTHLMQGTTTILNVDGLVTPEEAKITQRCHPINLKTCTMHMPEFIKAIETITGCPGLKSEHRNATIEGSLKKGAVAIGEVEELTVIALLFCVPELLWRRTGKLVSLNQVRALKKAILGDVENPPTFDSEKISGLLESAGLAGIMTPEEIKSFMEKKILKPHILCRDVYVKTGELAEKFGAPMIVHHALESKDWVLKLMRKHGKKVNIIAAHCDSVTFEDIEESVEITRQLKKLGSINNITSYLDNHTKLTEICVRLFEEKLVDNICTDALSKHDSMLFFIEKLIEEKLTTLCEAIKMVTSGVVQAIPDLAPNRGLVRAEKIADLVLLDGDKISNVDMVMLGGEIILKDGDRPNESIPLMEPPVYGPGGRPPKRDLKTKLPVRLCNDL